MGMLSLAGIERSAGDAAVGISRWPIGECTRGGPMGGYGSAGSGARGLIGRFA